MNAPIVLGLLALVTTGAFLFSGQKEKLITAASSLVVTISKFQVHKLDLISKIIEFNITLVTTNPTQTTIPLSDLVIRVSIQDAKGVWRTLSTSRPVGQFKILPGNTAKTLRFSSPIVLDLIRFSSMLLEGNSIPLFIEAFPEVANKKMEPVNITYDLRAKDISTDLLKKAIGLGKVANNPVKIKSSRGKYDRFFNLGELKFKDKVVRSGDTFDTINEMTKLVKSTLNDTKAIAKELKKPTVKETIEAVFNFANDNFNYKLDEPGIEQIRRPLRSYQDRFEGIDCDCFSVLQSSILTNLNIPHFFRKAKYDGNGNYSHIYVIAQDKGQTYVLDPVVGEFDVEHPFDYKFDKKIL